MDVLKIIERLERLKEGIESAFEKGHIDFDVIVGELEAIGGELQANPSGKEARAFYRPRESREMPKLVDIGDFR